MVHFANLSKTWTRALVSSKKETFPEKASEKSPFNRSCRLTQSTVCNSTKNKLQIKFAKEALELADNLHSKLQASKLQPSALHDF